MGVFKEEAYAFETVAKKQKQIFTDAADLGYPFKYDNPPKEISAVLDAITSFQSLDKEFSNERPLVRNRSTWKGGVSVDIIIFWENDEGYYRGTKYHVAFSHLPKHASLIEPEYNAMISIDVEPYSEKA